MWKRKSIRSGVKNSIDCVVDVRWTSRCVGVMMCFFCIFLVWRGRWCQKPEEEGKKQLISTATEPISQQQSII